MNMRLGQYEIVAELGRGGMGVVYKAYEADLDRYVAIKVLSRTLGHDAGVRERFLREARSMAALNDPHIVQIHSIGEEAGQPYFVMEFVAGESLSAMLRRLGTLNQAQAASVTRQAALGLAAAHDHGVTHRDVKPGNLMISSRGAVKVADFGIALSSQDMSSKLTSTGELVGTPGYLSPEVCLGKPVDQRSDIFSLGIVLFEMLTGETPFKDESPLGLMLEVVEAKIPDVRQIKAETDVQLAGILQRMIAKDPAERYQDCHALAADLAALPMLADASASALVPQPSAAALTRIGDRAPEPEPASQPVTAPTPAAGMAATTTTPAAHGVDRPRRRGLGWAVAAVLLVGAGASAWALQDHVPFVGAWLDSGKQRLAAQDEPQAPSDRQEDEAGAGTDDGFAWLLDDTQDEPGANDGWVVADDGPGQDGAPDLDGLEDDDLDGLAADPLMSDDGLLAMHAGSSDLHAPDAPGDGAPDGLPAVPVEAAPDVSPLAGGPGGSADSGAVVAAVPAPVQQAARKAAPPPRPPVIALAAAGDDVIADPALEELMNALQRGGFNVIETGSGGGQPDFGALAGRADAVVVLQAKPVGRQELTYYGQSSTLYTVQFGIKTYRVTDGRVLWSSPLEQVNFTTLNAAEKAREAVAPLTADVERNLAEYRARR